MRRLWLISGQRVQELMFIGMKPSPVNPAADPQAMEKSNMIRRKLQQAENMREYSRDIVMLKTRVRDNEGQDMRETIQDKINAWFVENRDPLTGDYPDFPEVEDGGCVPSPSMSTVDLSTSFVSK